MMTKNELSFFFNCLSCLHTQGAGFGGTGGEEVAKAEKERSLVQRSLAHSAWAWGLGLG